MEALQNSLQKNWPQVLQSLCDLIRIPSISFPGFDPQEVARCAQATATLFESCGWQQVQIVHSATGAPAVLAAWDLAPEAPTVLLYAHHDIQPPMREELWDSPPFVPQIREGRLFGRGAADDKAGVVLHAYSLALALQAGLKPRVNLRVLIEGEEETGSQGLAQLLTTHRDFLHAQTVIVADLANWETGIPAITTSLRGMVGLEIELSSTKAPLHSGLWSGPLPDPAMALCRLLASLCDANGQVVVPQWDKGLQAPTPRESKHYQSLQLDENTLRHQAGVLDGVHLLCLPDHIPQSLWRKPSLTVTAMQAGDRRNAGNVLQNCAWARLSLRIAPGMDWKIALNAVENHLRSNLPWGMQLQIKPEEGAAPWLASADSPDLQKMLSAMESAYQQPARLVGCGASIPGAQLFQNAFANCTVLLTGLEDPHCKAHGENESMDLADLQRALLAQMIFFQMDK